MFRSVVTEQPNPHEHSLTVGMVLCKCGGQEPEPGKTGSRGGWPSVGTVTPAEFTAV